MPSMSLPLQVTYMLSPVEIGVQDVQLSDTVLPHCLCCVDPGHAKPCMHADCTC